MLQKSFLIAGSQIAALRSKSIDACSVFFVFVLISLFARCISALLYTNRTDSVTYFFHGVDGMLLTSRKAKPEEEERQRHTLDMGPHKMRLHKMRLHMGPPAPTPGQAANLLMFCPSFGADNLFVFAGDCEDERPKGVRYQAGEYYGPRGRKRRETFQGCTNSVAGAYLEPSSQGPGHCKEVSELRSCS